MGEIIDLKRTPPVDDQELVADLCRFSEGLLTEKQVKKRHKLAESTWDAYGNDEEFILKIENEKLRRIRDGSTKREKSQALITKAPDILDAIASDSANSPRHRVDAIKTLDGMAANGPVGVPAADRFQITINLSGDGVDHVLHFDKSVTIDANDRDPFNDDVDTVTTPWGMFLANSKKDGGDNGGHI